MSNWNDFLKKQAQERAETDKQCATLAKEIMQLVFKLNQVFSKAQPDHAISCHLSGHVNNLDIDVIEKEGCKMVWNQSFYTSGSLANPYHAIRIKNALQVAIKNKALPVAIDRNAVREPEELPF